MGVPGYACSFEPVSTYTVGDPRLGEEDGLIALILRLFSISSFVIALSWVFSMARFSRDNSSG